MRTYRVFSALGALLLLTLLGGCAQQPPTQNALSGRRLRVTMNFYRPVSPSYYYFFVINYASAKSVAGDNTAPGPVPILLPPFTPTGFVIGSDGSTFGFTDYMEFSGAQPASTGGYELYHVVHNSSTNPQEINSIPTGGPVAFTPQDPNATSGQIQFEIDLAQLVRDTNGNALADQNQAINQARQIRYLEVNIIATDTISFSAPEKWVDSMGDNRSTTAASTYLILDLQTKSSWRDTDTPDLKEPTGDVFLYNSSAADPAIDLTSWTIQYVTT